MPLPTNELLHAAQQQVIEEERCSAQRSANEANLAKWHAKGGPECWLVQVLQEERLDLLQTRSRLRRARRHA